MTRTLIQAHTLLTRSTVHGDLQGGALLVEDGVIRQVGPLAELRQAGGLDAVVGDPERHIALPGMVNGHHHSLRPPRVGLPAAPLELWLVRSRMRQLPPLTEEELYDHTLWGTLLFLRSGATAVVDHYNLDPLREDYGVPAAVRAYLDAGVRAAVCVSCSDQQRLTYQDDGAFAASLGAELPPAARALLRPFDADTFFARWERLAREWDGREGRIRLGFGPGGPQWCSDGLLRRIRQVADEHDRAPVQIHLLESKFQALHGYRTYGHSVVRHLAEIGFFAPATSCAHCVWVSQEDIQRLADAGATAIHNPSSNLLLSNGIAPLADMLSGGMRVGFGLDAAGIDDTLDMLADLRLAWLQQRRTAWGARELTAGDMLDVATHGGADALGLGVPLGRLEAGHAADVVLVDRSRLYDSPYVSPTAPADEVLVRRGAAQHVDHVLVGGRLVVEDGQPVGIDVQALRARVAASLQRVYELLPTIDEQFASIEPAISAFYAGWERESEGLLPHHYQVNTR